MAAYRTLAQMRWSDMDALGHVHNATFLQYFELARARLVFELMGVPHRSDASLVVGRHEIDYLIPLVYRPEPIAVDTAVRRIGTSSFTLAGEVREPDGDAVYARIVTVIVAIDVRTGAPVPLSETVRSALGEYREADPVQAGGAP